MQNEKWILEDHPAEKLMLRSAGHLSDKELLSAVIGGNDISAVDIAGRVLTAAGGLGKIPNLSTTELTHIPGITRIKAARIAAAFEIGRRKRMEVVDCGTTVRRSEDFAQYLKAYMENLHCEVFVTTFLNRANKIIAIEQSSQGGITGTVADPRLILRRAIELRATSLVLSHNHPSGNLRPSRADEEITQKIKQAAAYLDIKVLDHIIISEEGYFSFADEGII